jgi:hypothetical protein
MKPAIEWIKGNVLIVVFGVVAFLALGAGWWFSSSLNADVRKQAEERAGKLNELNSVEKGTVTLNIPGREPVTKSLVINRQVLDQYKEVSGKLRADADQVRKLALDLNRGDHRPIVDGVFPEPPIAQRETAPFKVHKALVAAYDDLLKSVNAGSPPLAEQVGEDLLRRESQFIQSTLKKAGRENLDPTELESLKQELIQNRLAIYGENAQRFTVYADASALEIPSPPANRKVSLGELFDWQWKYWITRDVLEAIEAASAAANGGTPGNVLKSPVKRVLSISIPDGGFAARQAPPSASFGGNAGFGGAADPNAGGGEAAPVDGAAAAAPGVGVPQIDAAAEAQRDYAVSFTGRKTNPLYDVRQAEVVLVAETSRLPELFDALAKQNFITVLDTSVRPADPFSAASEGFIYGKAPVSIVRLKLESVWLREWMAPLMPPEVRAALGVQTAPAVDPAAAVPPGQG